MKQESIEFLKDYISGKKISELSARKLNYLLAVARMCDDKQKIKEYLPIIEDNKLFELLSKTGDHIYLTELKAIKQLSQSDEFRKKLAEGNSAELKNFVSKEASNQNFSDEEKQNIIKNIKFGVHHTTSANLDSIEQNGLKCNKRSDIKNSKTAEALTKLGIETDKLFLNDSSRDGVFYSGTFIFNYCVNSPEWIDRLMVKLFHRHISEITKNEAMSKLNSLLDAQSLSAADRAEIKAEISSLIEKYLETEPSIVFINFEEPEKDVGERLKYLESLDNESLSYLMEEMVEGQGNNVSTTNDIPKDKLVIAKLQKEEKQLEPEGIAMQ